MFWKPFIAKSRSAIKEHWVHSPLPVLIIFSWPVLPSLCKIMVVGFALLLFIYDLTGWHYKRWSDENATPYQQKVANKFHFIVSSILVITPIVCMAAFEMRHWIPRWADSVVCSTVADIAITNKVSGFVFGVGSPHPTNYLASYIGTASPTGACLFEFTPLFQYIITNAIGLLMQSAGYLLVAGLVGIPGLLFYEAVTESAPKGQASSGGG
jgi:hypothetical protein